MHTLLEQVLTFFAGLFTVAFPYVLGPLDFPAFYRDRLI
jgi:hypothetical protein